MRDQPGQSIRVQTIRRRPTPGGIFVAPFERAPFVMALWAGALVIVMALMAGASFAQGQARQPTAAEAGGLVRPNDMGFGGLLLESEFGGLYVEAPLVATDVQVTVTGIIARTRVTQHFKNPSEGWVEGKYVFPLPDEAAVDTLRMVIGDRVIEGVIKEREEARIIYEEAKAEGKKASLVEQERPNIFTNSVANIGPGETVIVQIEYQEHARLDSGTFSLRFPMVVAPRYNPAPQIQMVSFNERGWSTVSDPVPDRARIEPPYLRPDEDPDAPIVNPVTLTVNLNTGFALGEIASAYHDVAIHRDGDDRATLTLKDGEVAANRDFELTWSAKAKAVPQAALFRETVDGEDYLLAVVVPPRIAGDDTAPIRPRETVFVIDNSGSMGGESIRQAKASLLLALDRLNPEDRFNVIRFDDTMDMVFSNPVPATAVNLRIARDFVRRLDAQGGTEMLPALQISLVDLSPEDTTRVRQVIFLTDGAIGNEAQLFSAIDQGLGRSRLFTVGIGSAPNSYFMSRAARIGRGTFLHIGDLKEVQARMGALFAKLEQPVMTDLAAAWPNDGTVAETWPSPLPDLYAGEPVVISAKLTGASPRGTLRLVGNLAGTPWAAELPLSGAVDGTGVAQLWARKKIASIEESRFDGADWTEVDAGVLEVALKHHLVSRLTSLVAVDVTPSRPAGARLTPADIPLNLPAGWDFDKVFGPDLAPTGDTRDTRRADAGLVQLAALKVSPTAPAATGTRAQSMMLPQGSTASDWLLWSGFLSFLLALSAWTALAWPRPATAPRR